MKRRLLVVPLALALAGAVYLLLLRNTTVTANLIPTRPTAMIGSGGNALAVGADGAILSWLPPPEEGSLPKLPLDTAPEDGRLHGPVLEQAKVLGAAPAALRPYVEGSYLGESGVDVKLVTGVELRFGSASAADRKWRAAAAVLANSAVTALDYVDLHSPGHPDIGGSGHTLPPVP